jgi:hypothetical protein
MAKRKRRNKAKIKRTTRRKEGIYDEEQKILLDKLLQIWKYIRI